MCDFDWCRVDWDATGSMLQGWGALLGAISVAAAAYVGQETFGKWKKQKIAERKFEVAERVVTCVYRVERALNHVRNPATWGPELKAAEDKLREKGEWPEGISEADANALRQAQVFLLRIDEHQSLRSDIIDLLPQATALFGDDLEKALLSLSQKFHVVGVYALGYYRDRNTEDMNLRSKIERSVWTGYPTEADNEMDQEIRRDGQIVRQICLPFLRDGID